MKVYLNNGEVKIFVPKTSSVFTETNDLEDSTSYPIEGVTTDSIEQIYSLFDDGTVIPEIEKFLS